MSVKIRLDLDTSALIERVNHAMSEGLQEGLHTVETAAKDNCPVDTGALRNSIYTDVKEDESLISGSIIAPMEYATYVHEGTSRMSARPFLYNALVENMGQIEQAVYRKITLAVSE
ncbi:MAG: HK97-gp10 family putative phage morphogenesis protein [Methanomicrobiales archaeon]